MSNSPAVVIKSKFQAGSSGGSSFNNYLEYIDRAETKTKDNGYESYQDYMSNEEKTTGIFTNAKDILSDDEKKAYKEVFKTAQENGSVLWQDVISFDNEWLKEMGVLYEGGGIDEKKLKEATRSSVNEMLKSEQLLDSAVWTAAIHYNTDNIHIHVATVQINDFRERGKRMPKSISKMKSTVANRIMDRSLENQKLNEFIRKDLVNGKKEDKIVSFKNRIVNRDLVKQFEKVYGMLPEDKRLWKYNMNALSEVRPEINKLTDMYIERNHKDKYQKFLTHLDKEVDVYKRTYGNNSGAVKYKETKINDMYTRMGNALLGEMKEYDKKKKELPKGNPRINTFYTRKEINNIMFLMNRYTRDNLEQLKNQRAFEELQREQEHER
ncbi:MobP2 family relaxase [Bhargavaea beijingensis]|uniref:MobP2 family relaxase n=1 Tax=Bhargavaea beijingensis TaxID=426756 RepID=UPI0022250961|nr:MobP2 family relaxase [Bhargavaea beijingensis]MCW1929576.1 relaxase MobL [Bhargavaea beijingensis]